MAERLDSFDFDAHHQGGRGHGHPWDEWLDGSAWRLTAGIDFRGSVANFASLAWKRANARGLGLRTHRDGDDFVIQAVARESADG